MRVFYRVVGCIRLWRYVSFSMPPKVHGYHLGGMWPSACRARDRLGLPATFPFEARTPPALLGTLTSICKEGKRN